MSEQSEMMVCDWCGKEFPADARACVEGGIEAVYEPEEGEEWRGEQPIALDPVEFTPEQLAGIKKAMEINDQELNQLIRTGKIDGMGAIVCLECQDAAAAEDE